MDTTIYLPDTKWGFAPVSSARKLETDGAKYGFAVEYKEVEGKDRWGWNTSKLKVDITPKGFKLNPLKDTYRVNVYRAEWKLKENMAQDWELGDIKGIRDYLTEVWTALKIDLPRPAIKYHDKKSCTAYVYQGWIGMARAKWSHNKLTVLHEAAHMLCPPGENHGPMFTRTLLDLVVKFLGNEVAEQLFDNYLNGTQHSKKRWTLVDDKWKAEEGRKTRVTRCEVGAPRLGLARLGMQTGFSTGVPATNLVSPIVARQIGMEVA